MKMMPAAFVLVTMLYGQANATLMANSSELNGTSFNGANLNGASLNGVSMQGVALNGKTPQGTTLNTSGGIELSGLQIVNIELAD